MQKIRYLWYIAAVVYMALALALIPSRVRTEYDDFADFYHAGKIPLSRVYDLQAQRAAMDGLPKKGVRFFHLPLELVVFRGLSHLPEGWAFALWTVLNLGCVLAAALVLKRHFPAFDPVFAFAIGPTFVLAIEGQNSGILLLVLTLGFHWMKDRPFAAGIILSLGLIKLQFVLPIILIIRNRKMFAGFASGSLAFFLQGLSMVGWQGLMNLRDRMTTAGAYETWLTMICLRGPLLSLGADNSIAIVASVLLLSVVIFSKWERDAIFSVAVVTTLLVSFHAYFYDAVLLLIPCAWLSAKREYAWFSISLVCVFPIALTFVSLIHKGLLTFLFVLPMLALLTQLSISKRQTSSGLAALEAG